MIAGTVQSWDVVWKLTQREYAWQVFATKLSIRRSRSSYTSTAKLVYRLVSVFCSLSHILTLGTRYTFLSTDIVYSEPTVYSSVINTYGTVKFMVDNLYSRLFSRTKKVKYYKSQHRTALYRA